MLISSNTPRSIDYVHECLDYKIAELLDGAKQQHQITLDVVNLKITTTVLMTFEGLRHKEWPPNKAASAIGERVYARGTRKWVYNPNGKSPDSMAKSITQLFPIQKLYTLSKDTLASDLMKQIEKKGSYTLESINLKMELLDSKNTVQNSFSPTELSFKPESVIICAIERLESF